jgi:hypothetical protein
MSLTYDLSKAKIVNMEEAKSLGLCPGDLTYFAAATKKHFILLRAGEFVTEAFLEKYQAKGFQSFYLHQVVKVDFVEQYKNALKGLQEIRKEDLHQQSMRTILDCFISGQIQGTKPLSQLDLFVAQYSVLGGLEAEFMSHYAASGYVLFKRSLSVASMVIPFLLHMGYRELHFLKEVYNAILLMDYPLIGERYTLTMRTALQKEAQVSHSGMEFLQKSSPKEASILKAHTTLEGIPPTAYDFKCMAVKDLFEFHHASLSRQSFPENIDARSLPDWICAVIFFDKLVSYEDTNFTENDGTGYIKKILKNKSIAFFQSYGFFKIKSALTHWLPEEKLAA